MAHLGGKGPLGQKQKKGAESYPSARKALTERVSPLSGLRKIIAKVFKKRKPIPKVSAKRAAYLASPERTAGKAHMARVALQHCLVCGAWPVDVHHLPSPRNDLRTIPLCPFHHRKEYGPQAYHYSRRNFNALHGSDEELLARSNDMLQK